MRRAGVMLAAVAAFAGSGAQAATYKTFVACPMVQDTSTVPCWVSSDGTELYYLGIQTDISAEFHPPSLGHKVLVEGEVSDEPRICGGVVLKPVKVSIIPELDAGCNRILPARADYEVPFAPRPPGPSGGRLAFDRPVPPPPPTPQPPYKAKSFVIRYDFDERKVSPRETQAISDALAYAKLTGAKTVKVVAWRGATKLSSGTTLAEAADVGEARARQVAELLREVGPLDLRISTEAKSAVRDADGRDDYARRRAEIVVEP